MPAIRAIDRPNLVPLRGAGNSLLTNHRKYHPNDPLLPPSFYSPSPETVIAGYGFYGHFVACNKGYHAAPLPMSEVAALLLEQTFGRAERVEEAFTTDWGMAENVRPGKVFWDTTNDRIIAETREGFTLAICGTNLIEAAVYLPRMYQTVLANREKILRGVNIVEIQIEGPSEEWAMAASPLQIKCRVPNLDNAYTYLIDHEVLTTFQRAIANQK
jgi:hypothetical protein